MSNISRATLMMSVFVGGLAGFAWIISAFGGYRFGFTLSVFVGAYVTLVLAYVCYRRSVQRFESASRETNTPAKTVSPRDQ
jgi:hypothetical protein